MPEAPFGVFISYRRESAAAFAGRLYDSLAGKLGEEHVFIDVDHIEPGADFVEVLQKKLASAVAVIVLIGRDWVTCKDAGGNSRLANPSDFVRLEIATALDRNVRVIPVLFDGASMPSSQDLPPNLTSLTRHQAIEIDHRRFHQDAAKLIEFCQTLLAERSAEEERIAKEKTRETSRLGDWPYGQEVRLTPEEARDILIDRERANPMGSLLVLVVDDDEDLRLLARMVLTQAGHRVLEAENGERGLQTVDTRKPDLMILDPNMPGMDGFEVLRRLRKRETGKPMPVILLTAWSDEDFIKRSLELGATEVMLKPFTPPELWAKVRACFARAQSARI